MSKEKTRRRPGVKPRGPFEDKRKTLTTRITGQTREHLEQAALRSDRSLSQEIEFRLEQSFKSEQRANEIAAQSAGAVYGQFGRPETFQVLALLAQAIRTLEDRADGANWLEDPALFRNAKAALRTILHILEPGKSEAQTNVLILGLRAEQAERLGEEAATAAIQAWADRIALAGALRTPRKRPKKSA